jgi:hypothetical protein
VDSHVAAGDDETLDAGTAVVSSRVGAAPVTTITPLNPLEASFIARFPSQDGGQGVLR